MIRNIYFAAAVLFAGVSAPVIGAAPAGPVLPEGEVSAQGESARGRPVPREAEDIPQGKAAERGREHGSRQVDGLHMFKANASAHPHISARALIKLLKEMNAGQAEQFINMRYGFHVAEMLSGLQRLADSQGISVQDYQALISELASYDLHVRSQRRSGLGDVRPGAEGRAKNYPVEAIMDAREAVESGSAAEAEAGILGLAGRYPGNVSVQSAAAEYFNGIHNYAMAEKTATDAIKLDENNPDAYKTRSFARSGLEDRKGALEDIKKAMSLDPQDESAKILFILLESKKDLSALKSLSSVEEIKKALGAAEGGPPDGVSASEAAPRIEPGVVQPGSGPLVLDYGKSQAYLQSAHVKTRLGDYKNTVKYSTLSIEKNPDNTAAYLERANAMNFLGRYDEAVRDTTLVLQKDPSNLAALNMRAWALNKKGLSGSAEADSSKAIGINPMFADAWFNRALSYEKRGDYGKTLENLKQAAALSSAYQVRYQDAVAQYGAMAPGFSAGLGAASAGVRAAYEGAGAQKRSPLKTFFILAFFTLSGGVLVAMGLVHIITSKKGLAAARNSHPDVLSPAVFYEGVATGKYKIVRKIGSGGMGVVYEAADQSLGRKVAIKKMNDEIKLDAREKQRFLEEARTVALLHHPNIVEIYTIFEEGDNIYLVFEYVSGSTLDRLIDSQARLSPETAVKIFEEVSMALAYAHSKNIVHRDLKPSNIMYSAEGEVKVMDFGLASRAQEARARFSSKEVVGSPAYMAPEQDLGVCSAQADIYSLGICLYEALSGTLPFPGPDFRRQKATGLYRSLCSIVPGLPKEVDALLEKALAPEPERRFHSAEEFRSALQDTFPAGGFVKPGELHADGEPGYKIFPA